jgi:hypothetical protein
MPQRHGLDRVLGGGALALGLTTAACSSSGGGGNTQDADAAVTADGSAGDVSSTSGDGGGDDGGSPASAWDGGAFVHPGVLSTTVQLDFVKQQIAAGQEPWKSALAAAEASTLTQPSYMPTTPPSTILCASKSGGPDMAFCQAEQSDSEAAYANAILWYLTGNAAYAQKAIQIMDTWSAVFTSHGPPLDKSATNQYVQSGWTGSNWAPAAELIKYTYTSNGGWPNAGRFAGMLKTGYLPYLVTSDVRKPFIDSTMADPLVPNGNWEDVMIGAGMGVAVFLDDPVSFAAVLTMWRERTPAYMYLLSDGPYPKPPPLAPGIAPYTQAQIAQYWGGPTSPQTFPLPSPDGNGFGQETCRDVTDMHHQEWGYSGLVAAAETAYIQGVDLYGEEQSRIVAAYEFAAYYLNGATVPSWLCPGSGLKVSAMGDNYEIGYNHYANRLGIPMPNTVALLAKIRPTGANHGIVFETLTHADVH